MRLLERRRWWRERGLAELRLLVLEHWDPLNVYDDANRADAYDAYLERIGRMLRRGAGTDAIATYLGEVRTKALGLDENVDADGELAGRVSAWYALERPGG